MARQDQRARLVLSRFIKNDVEPVLRKPARRPFGPLDQQSPVGQGIVQAQLRAVDTLAKYGGGKSRNG